MRPERPACSASVTSPHTDACGILETIDRHGESARSGDVGTIRGALAGHRNENQAWQLGWQGSFFAKRDESVASKKIEKGVLVVRYKQTPEQMWFAQLGVRGTGTRVVRTVWNGQAFGFGRKKFLFLYEKLARCSGEERRQFRQRSTGRAPQKREPPWNLQKAAEYVGDDLAETQKG